MSAHQDLSPIAATSLILDQLVEIPLEGLI